MPPNLAWFLILLLIAAVLLAAELVIPSHGVLTVLACAALLGMAYFAFTINRWFGLGSLAALAILGPIVGALMLGAWQRSPIGRRLTLTSVVANPVRPTILVGSIGITLGELRPMGECEFGDIRIRARSEMGDVIAAGRAVKVIAVNSDLVTVRESNTTTSNV